MDGSILIIGLFIGTSLSFLFEQRVRDKATGIIDINHRFGSCTTSERTGIRIVPGTSIRRLKQKPVSIFSCAVFWFICFRWMGSSKLRWRGDV